MQTQSTEDRPVLGPYALPLFPRVGSIRARFADGTPSFSRPLSLLADSYSRPPPDCASTCSDVVLMGLPTKELRSSQLVLLHIGSRSCRKVPRD